MNVEVCRYYVVSVLFQHWSCCSKERAEKPEINLSSLSVSCCDGEITDDKLLAGASWTRRFHSDHSSLL